MNTTEQKTISFFQQTPHLTEQTKENWIEITTSSSESASESLSTPSPAGLHPAGGSILRVGSLGRTQNLAGTLAKDSGWIEIVKNSKKEIKTSDKGHTVMSNRID